MRRIRLPLGRSLLFLSVFLFALVALLPLRLAIDWLGLDRSGLSAREAVGSIWLGALKEARFGQMPIGDVNAALRTAPLLLGRARVDLGRSSDTDPLKASLTVSRHAFGLDDVTGAVQAAALFAPLPISRLDLDDLSAHFAKGTCSSADGKVTAQINGEVAGVSLPGGFSGNARCEAGGLLLPLVSQTGLETMNLRLSGEGRYVAEFMVRPSDAALAERLLTAGFALAPDGAYVTRVEGSL